MEKGTFWSYLKDDPTTCFPNIGYGKNPKHDQEQRSLGQQQEDKTKCTQNSWLWVKSMDSFWGRLSPFKGFLGSFGVGGFAWFWPISSLRDKYVHGLVRACPSKVKKCLRTTTSTLRISADEKFAFWLTDPAVVRDEFFLAVSLKNINYLKPSNVLYWIILRLYFMPKISSDYCNSVHWHTFRTACLFDFSDKSDRASW